MKTQRRHELQTNVLADYLGKRIQELRPHAQHLTIGAVAIVVVILAVLYFSSQQRASAGVAWADYFSAIGNRDANKLEEVASHHRGSVAGLWARQAAGDLKLAGGCGLLYTDRKEAQKSLREAEEHFLAIESQAASYPMLQERCRFGLAQTYEGFSELGKAVKYYELVAKSKSGSPLAKVAQRRAEQLSDKSVENWYNWFERQQPAPRRTPKDGQADAKDSADAADKAPAETKVETPAKDAEPGKTEAGKADEPVPPAPAAKDAPAAPGEKPAPQDDKAPKGDK